MGLIASGKSTISSLFSQKWQLGNFNSDVVRKEIARTSGLDLNGDSQFGKGLYSSEYTRRTYDALLAKASQFIKAGKSVVLDGSYQDKDERQRVEDLGQQLTCRVIFINCFCDDEETKRRLKIRANDQDAISDGTWSIYLQQKDKYSLEQELSSENSLQLNTNNEPDLLLAKLATKLAKY